MIVRPSRPGASAVAALALLAGLAPAAEAKRPATAKPRLVAFDSCRDLLRYGSAGLARTNGYAGVPMRAGSTPQVISTPPIMPQAEAGAGGVVPPGVPTAAPTAAAPPMAVDDAKTAGEDFSGTNTQETGVDEPDVIKTDGDHVYAVTDSTLRIVDVSGDAPRLVGSLPLEGYGHRILLRGTRVLVAATQATAANGPMAGVTDPAVGRPTPSLPPAMVAPGVYEPTTVLTEVDVRDPAAPKIARTLTVKGTFVDARLTGGTVRIVIGSTPEPTAVAADGQEAAAPTVRTFVPRTVLRSRRSGRTFRRDLASCREIRHPRAFSGAGLLTVMTVNLDRGLYSVDRDAVMAGAQVVYGSPTSLYVASERYRPALEEGKEVPDGVRTEIHRFDASKDGETTYAGSGDVPGFILNQYALSEHEGVLRVASTEQPPWFPGSATAGQSETGVSTLAVERGGLVKRGRVGGLGRGERVYAVRFVGDTGYVVTFRQVDPLYVLDLRDPAAPRTVGELKVAGYSAYLHPVGDGLLLGVGQDATENGLRLGAQVSLFDVSKPSAPTRVAQYQLGGNGSSTVEFDPHAFLYWDRTKLAVLPFSSYGPEAFEGAVGLRVAPSAITKVGTIDHRTAERPYVGVDRSLVVGDRVVSLSYRGIGTSRLDTLAPVGFAAFE